MPKVKAMIENLWAWWWHENYSMTLQHLLMTKLWGIRAYMKEDVEVLSKKGLRDRHKLYRIKRESKVSNNNRKSRESGNFIKGVWVIKIAVFESFMGPTHSVAWHYCISNHPWIFLISFIFIHMYPTTETLLK